MPSLPQPKKKRWYTRPALWICVCIVLLIGFAVVSIMSSMQKSQKEALSYLEQTVTPEIQDIEKTIAATGTIVVDKSLPLTPEVSGKVKEVRVAVGDLVSKDQVLFTIDTPIPATAAQKEVMAPFDGRVLSLSAFVESPVVAGVPVGTVGYRSTHVEFFASDAEAVLLRKGQQAHVSVPAVNGGRDVYEGEVTFVDIQKTASSQNTATGQIESGYLVEVSVADLPEPIRNRLGLVVDIDIVTDERKGVLAIDRSSVQYDEDDAPFVYKAPELTEEFYQRALTAKHITDVLERIDIRTGFEGDDAFEVLDGLSEGDAVLLFVPQQESTTLF